MKWFILILNVVRFFKVVNMGGIVFVSMFVDIFMNFRWL